MAIKINGQDLQKRFIGTTEIVRVYKNYAQVRPDTVTPYYTPGAYRKDGLISFSTDGTNWTTMADKNLGATSTYHWSGTYEGVCGKIYQWGNYYGFPGPRSYDTITTSSTQVDASAYGPSNHYSSSTWITNDQWTVGSAKNLWDAQGPCPSGYHIPDDVEWANMKTSFNTLYNLNSDNAIYFTGTWWFPPVGHRDATTSLDVEGSGGCYWVRNIRDRGVPGLEVISTSGFDYLLTNGGQGGMIRPFKDTAIIPDSSWTSLTLEALATLFYSSWNPSLGLISVSSGVNLVTIADKNLGATTVYNRGDTLSDSNCGLFYQWGNNYGFSYDNPSYTVSQTVVDVTNYGVNNYYSSNEYHVGDGTIRIGFQTYRNPWYTPMTQSLWGNQSDDVVEQGPCPSGFHVMNYNELMFLFSASSWTSIPDTLPESSLKMPLTGVMHGNDGGLFANDRGTRGGYLLNYRSLLADSSLNPKVVLNKFTSFTQTLNATDEPNNYAGTIRPVKDIPVLPDQGWTTIYSILVYWNP